MGFIATSCITEEGTNQTGIDLSYSCDGGVSNLWRASNEYERSRSGSCSWC